MERVTKEKIQELAETDYFSRSDSPACMAILPHVEPYYTGVEIGVYTGSSSVCFLEHCEYMYFIDPCMEYDENADHIYLPNVDEFLANVLPAGAGRFTFIQKMSVDAAPRVPVIDFVFIDGNHSYEYVKQDIELYWPKVRRGGFMSGHDCHLEPVARAVNEFFGSRGIQVERHQWCWLVKKVDTHASDSLTSESP